METIQEAMSSEAVQNVLMQGYHANRIREALERMILLLGPEEIAHITQEAIVHELEQMDEEDLERLRRENAELRQMLMCKSCFIQRTTHLNLGCQHMMCETCSYKDFCGICFAPITIVFPVSRS
ncbi:uncharacterized protein LOC144627111 [Crassostrea virginica]